MDLSGKMKRIDALSGVKCSVLVVLGPEWATQAMHLPVALDEGHSMPKHRTITQQKHFNSFAPATQRNTINTEGTFTHRLQQIHINQHALLKFFGSPSSRILTHTRLLSTLATHLMFGISAEHIQRPNSQPELARVGELAYRCAQAHQLVTSNLWAQARRGVNKHISKWKEQHDMFVVRQQHVCEG